VTSFLPGWSNTRAWIIARPLSGFAETFAQYEVEVAPGGGSDTPEPDAEAQADIFLARGHLRITIDGQAHELTAGGYAFIPPGTTWAVKNTSDDLAQFHWIRKRYEAAPGVEMPTAFVTSDADVAPNWMSNTDKWGTTRFVDP